MNDASEMCESSQQIKAVPKSHFVVQKWLKVFLLAHVWPCVSYRGVGRVKIIIIIDELAYFVLKPQPRNAH